MFGFAFTPRQRQLRHASEALYNAAVSAARQPELYKKYSIPDTVDGRYDFLVLHIFILLNSLQQFDSKDAVDLGQKIFDLCFWDMDRNLREMGVGDLGVPRRIKAMMQAFNGRCHAYAEALSSEQTENLEKALYKNIYRMNTNIAETQISALGEYVQSQCAAMKYFSWTDFWSGQIAFQAG